MPEQASNIREVLRTPTQRNLEVHADLSGGSKIIFGNLEIILSPDDTISMARSLLQAIGYKMEVQDFPKLLRPQ
jgi:hypothetical protein